MSKIIDNYIAVTEGRLAKSEFLRQARQSLPGYINQFTSYEDALKIFRNKGILTEDIQYQCPGDRFPLGEIENGIRYELEQMEDVFDITSPSVEEYRKARKKAIENLGKDPLFYIKKAACGCDRCLGTQEDAEKKFGKDYKQKASEGEMKKAVVPHTLQENKSGREEDIRNAQRLFNALMAARAKKALKNRWLAKDANSVLQQVRKKFDLKTFVPKGLPASLKYDVAHQKFDDVWAREGAATTADSAKNTGVKLKESNRLVVKPEKLLAEALKSKVIGILQEAATANLAQISDENASIQGIPTILNNLENIVTEIESFILKESNKIQGVFDSIGAIKNEDGIPIGFKFTQPILQAFQKDLEPVLKKVSLDNIKLPEAPEIGDDLGVGPNIDSEDTDMTPEEKATLFTPKGPKPNPLDRRQ